MPGGRPVESVPQDKADAIIEWISEGNTLRDFCRKEGNPAFRTVYDWLAKDKEFAARFAHARESGHDSIADECLNIADTEKDANRAKVRVWTRLQLLAKWNPKRYGERIQQDISGELAVKRVISDI